MDHTELLKAVQRLFRGFIFDDLCDVFPVGEGQKHRSGLCPYGYDVIGAVILFFLYGELMLSHDSPAVVTDGCASDNAGLGMIAGFFPVDVKRGIAVFLKQAFLLHPGKRSGRKIIDLLAVGITVFRKIPFRADHVHETSGFFAQSSDILVTEHIIGKRSDVFYVLTSGTKRMKRFKNCHDFPPEKGTEVPWFINSCVPLTTP